MVSSDVGKITSVRMWKADKNLIGECRKMVADRARVRGDAEQADFWEACSDAGILAMIMCEWLICERSQIENRKRVAAGGLPK